MLSKEEQEEQEKIRGKQEERIGTKGNKKEITFLQAKKEVYKLIQQGWNYNKISKVGFFIAGRGFKRFSISEISRIKKDFETKEKSAPPSLSPNIDEDKASVFDLLDQGMDCKEIVSDTRFKPEFVESVFHQWLRLENYSPNLIDDIFEILRENGLGCKNENDLKTTLKTLILYKQYVDMLHYKCKICKKRVYIGPKRSTDWQADTLDALYFLSEHNYHHECGCSGPPCKL